MKRRIAYLVGATLGFGCSGTADLPFGWSDAALDTTPPVASTAGEAGGASTFRETTTTAAPTIDASQFASDLEASLMAEKDAASSSAIDGGGGEAKRDQTSNDASLSYAGAGGGGSTGTGPVGGNASGELGGGLGRGSGGSPSGLGGASGQGTSGTIGGDAGENKSEGGKEESPFEGGHSCIKDSMCSSGNCCARQCCPADTICCETGEEDPKKACIIPTKRGRCPG